MNCLSYCLTLFLAIVSAVTFGVDLYVNYTMMGGNKKSNNKDVSITNQHMTQITPELWVFNVWNVIYGLLIIWYIYIFYLLLCRQLFSRKNKSPLFPGIFWLLFVIINVLNGAWVYLFIHKYMIISGIILLALTLVLYLINLIAYRICWIDVTSEKRNNDCECYNNDDIVELSCCEIFLLRLLTLNGLPLYAMWCTIATCIQWAMIFQYSLFHLSDNVSCIITLSILSLLLLLFWHMELLVKREYFTYTWLPGVVLIVAFTAIINRYHSMGGHHRPGLFFVFILLIVSCFMLLVKILSLCCCPPKMRDPGFSRV